ncbi:MAG: SIS domain-containing protein [Planctomycetes bacterium]|nr:SIS domain-containing protein [Planctomycetota bacterium]
MKQLFERHSAELRDALANLDTWHGEVARVVELLRQTFAAGGTVFAAGNGGSATLAQHLSDEMVGRYKSNRPPLRVVALSADSAVITCIGNDFGFEEVFARQVEGLGRAGDVLLAYSTSGNSPNILAACRAARQHQMSTVAFTGRGGKLREMADLVVTSPGQNTARIQELDLHAIHLICEAFEP